MILFIHAKISRQIGGKCEDKDYNTYLSLC